MFYNSTMNPPQEFHFPFLKKEQVGTDTYIFYFDRKNSTLSFQAGQYIRIFLPHENMDERGDKRFFSISSSPLNLEHITITTKVTQSTFKMSLLKLQTGTPVRFFGPYGTFILKENETIPQVYLAGGIGITPFHSMITFASDKKLTVPLTLFVSFSTVEEAVFYEELMEASKNNPSIKVVYTITRPKESKKPWDGETGRISADLIKKYVSDFLKAKYMIAGPPKMVEAMEQMVRDMGVPQEQIRKENFTGY